jgi:peptidoglycan/LPS O-acetylase OafA/YrhL
MKVTDREWVSKAPKLRHVPAFDWIRGFGIFGVMIGHSFPFETLSFAAIVDIFFVISGFLITSLLLQEHRGHGRIDLKKFYARRSLRLLPLLYVVLVVVAVAGVIAKFTGLLDGTVFTLKELAKESVSAGLYVHNIIFPTLGGAWHGHLWTLSVEEQFYLVVGVLMVFGLTRGWIKQVTWMLIAAVVLIQVSRLFAIAGPFKGLAFAVWIQRPDSLMIGMLAAIANAYIPEPLSDRARGLLKLGGWLGAVGIFVAVWASTAFARNQLHWVVQFWPGDVNFSRNPQGQIDQLFAQSGWRLHMGRVYWLQWGFTLANWSFFFVTLAAFRVDNWWPNKVMSWKPLVWIGGALSYGLYIWHYPIQHFLRMAMGTTQDACGDHVNLTTCRAGDDYRLHVNPVIQLLLDCLLPFLIAIPTYYLVERKALTIKNRFQVEKIARGDAATAHAPPAASVASAPTAGATATGDGPGGPTTGPEVTASDQAP